ncbi:hypothetical protein RRG08_046203 [Elysia crispata]|uniref:Uncharacterized protein n=1 Tax=Elysia crispata TaxID=231223 RepID=A0AAE0XNB9_9GAST|nr:hypothetical protein RRG08_046203 [Elysia crispata]
MRVGIPFHRHISRLFESWNSKFTGRLAKEYGGEAYLLDYFNILRVAESEPKENFVVPFSQPDGGTGPDATWHCGRKEVPEEQLHHGRRGVRGLSRHNWQGLEQATTPLTGLQFVDSCITIN